MTSSLISWTGLTSLKPMSDRAFFRQVNRTDIRRIEIVATRLVEELLAGNYRSTFRGQGIEFDEVREYVPGDDIRNIDWNVTSRIGAPYTKIYREQRELILFLVTDVSASLSAGSGMVSKQVLAAQVFAILALAAAVNKDRVGAILFSDRIEKWVVPGSGKKHILRLINDLVKTAPEGRGSDLAAALKTVYKNLKRRGICFIISDFKTDGYWDALSLLARKHDCIALKLADPADSRIPSAGLVELTDPEGGRSMLAEPASAAFRRAYERFWKDQHRFWLESCRSRGVETLVLDCSSDPGMELFRFFQRRRRRRWAH